MSRAWPKTSSTSSMGPTAPPGGPSSPRSKTSSSLSAMFWARRCWPTPWPGRQRPRLTAPRPTAPARAVSSPWPARIPTNALSRPVPARPPGPSRKATATAAGGLFFPQSKSLGLDQSAASPTVQQKVTYARTVSRSFAEGSEILDRLADLAVSAKQVERVTRRIGAERVAERDAAVAAYQAVPLVEKFAVPAGVTPPDLAVVMADGGRLQIRDRTHPPPPDLPSPGQERADGGGGGWREAGRGGGGRGGEVGFGSRAGGQGGAVADDAQCGAGQRPLPGPAAVVCGRDVHSGTGAGTLPHGQTGPGRPGARGPRRGSRRDAAGRSRVPAAAGAAAEGASLASAVADVRPDRGGGGLGLGPSGGGPPSVPTA